MHRWVLLCFTQSQLELTAGALGWFHFLFVEVWWPFLWVQPAPGHDFQWCSWMMQLGAMIRDTR